MESFAEGGASPRGGAATMPRKDLSTPQLTLGVQRRDGQLVDCRLYKLSAGDYQALM